MFFHQEYTEIIRITFTPYKPLLEYEKAEIYKVFIIGVSKSSPKCLTFLTLTVETDIYTFSCFQDRSSSPLFAFTVSCSFRVLTSAAISDSKGQTH